MVFYFVQKKNFGQHESQNIYFFCRTKRTFFFQNLTLGYMTKTLNQIIFFSSTKIRIFFSATLGIRIFFLEKKNITPLQVKWSVPNNSPLIILHDHHNMTEILLKEVSITTTLYCKLIIYFQLCTQGNIDPQSHLPVQRGSCSLNCGMLSLIMT